MNVLAIDSSGDELSVALLKDKVLCGEIMHNTGENHSVQILSAISYIYEICRIGSNDIDLFVSTIGPGSFTGLRVGLSTIKGLAMAADKPVIGVSSITALATNAASYYQNICPMLDAQRGLVYTALYKYQDNFNLLPITDEYLTEVVPFLRNITGSTLFIGKGALNNMKEIKKAMPDNSFFLPAAYNYIRASSVASLGVMQFNNGQISNCADLIPHYLRPSEAERRMASDNKVGAY